MENNILPWLVVACPLLGFLFNAFAGAGLTGSPKPHVDAADATSASAHNAGPSDAATFEENPEVTAAGRDEHTGQGHADVHLKPGGKTLVGLVATGAILLAFVLSLVLFLQVSGMNGERRLFAPAFSWMPVALGNLSVPTGGINFGLMVDPLTSLMTLIITGVGTLIHLYSIGYMSHDKGYARYFTYLNLFVFFMLLLVMGSNLLVMFVGWEGVGLASYLLIGFYYERIAATNAGKKAFVVNRIGDAALLIALFLIYQHFGTFDFYGPNGILTEAGMINAQTNSYPLVAATIVPLLLFLGAAGKSAQIPLYVWLPDAMEGPTPVSALIHAATMVTGGVYLVARLHPLFLQSPTAMTVVAVVGLTTAVLAATIAVAQQDIKKVLAYSTVSQLGYMFLACGVGAFGTAMFHVTTHAFFKALLFLGAGSVIHAMNGEQDMRKMGGLKAKLPTTHLTMLIGSLAIAGIPGLAGFFSKDEILANAYAGPNEGGLGSPLLYIVGVLTSGLTAFYMFRMMTKVFYTPARYDAETAKHIHESPMTMLLPLYVLAFLSVFGGYIGGFAPLHLPGSFEPFLGATVEREGQVKLPQTMEFILVAVSSLAGIGGALLGWNLYKKARNAEIPAEARDAGWWRKLEDKYGVDEVYDRNIVAPGTRLSRWLWRTGDTRIVDGVVNGVGRGVSGLANWFKDWQSGYVRNYALSMLVGVVLVILGALIGLRSGPR